MSLKPFKSTQRNVRFDADLSKATGSAQAVTSYILETRRRLSKRSNGVTYLVVDSELLTEDTRSVILLCGATPK